MRWYVFSGAVWVALVAALGCSDETSPASSPGGGGMGGKASGGSAGAASSGGAAGQGGTGDAGAGGAEPAYYFPPPGEGLSVQDQRSPGEVGLAPSVVADLSGMGSRWALWRHGYLIHVEGDFNQVQIVASLRKTWHALAVGASLGQGRIPSYDQTIDTWLGTLSGNDALATWWHVMTQSAGFDYPYGSYPDYLPGEMWTYSDLNLINLCNALAHVWGKDDYDDDYADILRGAYFDAIGALGWSTSVQADGVHLHLDLEDMGRLGLLVLARGRWDGEQLVPRWFVEELESKRTYGMLVNYNGPNDGTPGLDADEFPEAPYGYLTWTNTDGDYYPGADTGWALGRGSGGTYVLWNHANGIVFAGVDVTTGPTPDGPPHRIEANITGPNPLAEP